VAPRASLQPGCSISAETVLKVDADTWLDPAVLERQPLPERGFLHGCRARAATENSRHLNGVLLVRRSDLLAVAGYDERMQHYGYDDTDLYLRLKKQLNITEGCLQQGLMEHVAEGHAPRGLTRIHHILHRRATTILYRPWHESRLSPSTWNVRPIGVGGGIGEGGSSDAPLCEAVATARAPFFLELLADSDEVLLAHQEALQQYAGRVLRWAAISSLHELGDIRTLMRVYEGIVSRNERYLAVHAKHGLANRMRAYCSARAFAQQVGLRLLLIWEPDVHTQTRFGDLFEADADVAVLSTFDTGIFPTELWKRFDHMVPDKVCLLISPGGWQP
jgi:hypothetical protein